MAYAHFISIAVLFISLYLSFNLPLHDKTASMTYRSVAYYVNWYSLCTSSGRALHEPLC